MDSYFDNLHCMLLKQNKRNLSLQLSVTCFSLLPCRALFNDGKKHVRTVNVRLQKAQNDLHKKHEDGHFAAATIRFAKDLASLLGNDCLLPFTKMLNVK